MRFNFQKNLTQISTIDLSYAKQTITQHLCKYPSISSCRIRDKKKTFKLISNVRIFYYIFSHHFMATSMARIQNFDVGILIFSFQNDLMTDIKI